MVDLRLLRKHKVFLSLKRDLAMVNLLSTLFFPYHSNNLLSLFFFFFLLILCAFIDNLLSLFFLFSF